MSEMIDRIAQAMFEHDQRKPHFGETIDWEQARDIIRRPYRDYARLALESAREPTEAMIDAGMAEQDTTLSAEWRAMIDEALK